MSMDRSTHREHGLIVSVDHAQGWAGVLPPGSGSDQLQQGSPRHTLTDSRPHPGDRAHQPWRSGDARQAAQPSYQSLQQGSYGYEGLPWPLPELAPSSLVSCEAALSGIMRKLVLWLLLT